MTNKAIIISNFKTFHTVEGIRFKPGQNEIDLESWSFAQRNALLKKSVAQGNLVVQWVTPGYDKEGKLIDEKQVKEFTQKQIERAGTPKADYPLVDLDQADAKEVISTTFDIPTLEAWKVKEDRKKLLGAIEAQISLIQEKYKKLESRD